MYADYRNLSPNSTVDVGYSTHTGGVSYHSHTGLSTAPVEVWNTGTVSAELGGIIKGLFHGDLETGQL